jgi:pimeloyl-ACP methyl ester carboxylesterase
MTGLILLLGVGLALAIASAIALTEFLLTHPPRRTYATALSRNRPGDPGELRGVFQVDGTKPVGNWPREFDAWTFTHRGVSIPVWRIKGDDPNGPIAILTHGWGDSRIGALSRVPYIARHCRACVMWDMPGHGDATGGTRLGSFEADFLAAVVRETTSEESPAEPDAPLMLVGWSLGAGVSLVAASSDELKPRVARVIIEAPYRLIHTPAASVLRAKGLPTGWTLHAALGVLGLAWGVGFKWRGFDRALHAAKVACPVLVLHGDADEVCPLEDAREIAAAAPNATLVVIPGGTHNAMWTDSASLVRAVPALDAFMAS